MNRRSLIKGVLALIGIRVASTLGAETKLGGAGPVANEFSFKRAANALRSGDWSDAPYERDLMSRVRSARARSDRIYVSSSCGDDRNDGRSPDRPLQSLNAAFRHCDKPTFIFLIPGNTWTEPVEWIER